MATSAVKFAREGFHSITPYLIVPGAAEFIDFAKASFGATELFRVKRPESDAVMHAEIKINDSIVELADATPQFAPRPASIHLYVPDTDGAYARALEAGATSIYEPIDQEYGDREAGVKDAFGNVWYIATHKTAQHIPEGLRTVTPYLQVQGAAGMVDFLKRAFAAEQVERHESPEGTIVHAKLKIGDSIVEMSEAHGPFPAMPFALHLYVPDTDAVYSRALEAGATSIQPPADQPYGDRSAGVKDAFGFTWFIATHLKDVHF
ncbi:MAG: VOC family protein [Candidatus Acidiferrales bacterium]